MYYKQLTEKKKVEIDILLKQNFSMREVGRRLKISHSTISRYKSNYYNKRIIDINEKYSYFINFFNENYDRRYKSVEVCHYLFRKKYPYARCVSIKQVYNWIHNNKLKINNKELCYKKRKNRSRCSGMMRHTFWNIENKTVLPISLRPKYIDDRNEPGHLEIDSIIGKKNEKEAIISIVDRCTRMTWLIKAEYRYDYYTSNIIYKYLIDNEILVKSITVDNGLEFQRMGITAKKLDVKLYKCDPYCSFQRGTNERMNAIVRRFVPKGSSFKFLSQIHLDDIMFKINAMPRKIFNFRSSFQVEMDY